MSRHEALQAAVAQHIRDLELEGLPPARVYEKLTRFDGNVTYPCVMVTNQLLPEKVSEKVEFFDSENLLAKYPVGVMVLQRGDHEDAAKAGPYLNWRDILLYAWLEWVPSVEGGFRARAEPGEILLPKGQPPWLRLAGTLVVWCEVIVERPEDVA